MTNQTDPFHVIARKDSDVSGVEDFAVFRSEIAARRALDDLPGWHYIPMRPGQTFFGHSTAKVAKKAPEATA